jgi:DNA polymerase III gamma/tau subunit
MDIMNRIVKEESIVMDQDAKQYLYITSKGSIRLLINYLEKMYILKKEVDLELCKKICSIISFQHFETYIKCLEEDRLTDAIDIFYNIYDYGYSVIDILDYFFTFIKNTNILSEDKKYLIIPLLCKYITIFHNLHEDSIELALFTNNVRAIMHS